MPLTTAELKDRIVQDVGDSGGFIDRQINTIWTLYDDSDSETLHFLYAKRHAARLLLGELGRQVLLADPTEREMLELRRRVLMNLLETIDADLQAGAQTVKDATVSISFVPATFGGATSTDEYSRGWS